MRYQKRYSYLKQLYPNAISPHLDPLFQNLKIFTNNSLKYLTAATTTTAVTDLKSPPQQPPSSMASSMLNLRYSPLPPQTRQNPSFFPPLPSLSFPFNNHRLNTPLRFSATPGSIAGGGSGFSGGNYGGGHGGDGGSGDWSSGGDDKDKDDSFWENLGLIGVFIRGWKSRVSADPQFPFKVLMEELVGVTSCVIGDMASRPNFGLNELDFVFSTLVVGSILNFVLMYLLAPTAAVPAAAGATGLTSIFSACPKSHMFEPGSFGLAARCGTFVYKGALFAAVGFAAGLVGTAISNGLIKLRKSMDPSFETPNKPPPTLLNAVTWALHMGLSSNFRYQTLNGVEFLLEKSTPAVVFKSSVIVLRCLNNVLGGMSFVLLARLTGSQSVKAPEVVAVSEDGSLSSVSVSVEEEKKLVNQST